MVHVSGNAGDPTERTDALSTATPFMRSVALNREELADFGSMYPVWWHRAVQKTIPLVTGCVDGSLDDPSREDIGR
jgi:hypothetical protein